MLRYGFCLCMTIFAIPKSIFCILFFYFFELTWGRLLWPVACTILGFFMNLTTVVITEGKMLHYISPCSFKLFYSLRCSYVFYCSGVLTLLIVSSIMTLFSIIYASSIFKLLFLLQRLLKCLLLLESIV